MLVPIFLIGAVGCPVPRSCPADLGRETLSPIENFETTSGKKTFQNRMDGKMQTSLNTNINTFSGRL
jgi:hypothetical protein